MVTERQLSVVGVNCGYDDSISGDVINDAELSCDIYSATVVYEYYSHITC